MTAPLLECRDVTAGHTSGNGTRVLFSGATFKVEPGGRLVVLGVSGVGKTSLLRLLNRLDDPLAGTVLFSGTPLTECDPLVLRRKVALVPQTPVMFEGTVADNLRARPRGLPLPDETRLAALLADVGLDVDLLHRQATTLSVGEQQRVAVARALSTDPLALLLDEPTSALDPKSMARMAELLVRLAEQRSLAIVAATHQQALLERLGGDVVILPGDRPGDASVRLADGAAVGAFFGVA